MALNKVQKRKLGIFLRCLIFSGLAWLLFATTNVYTYTKKMEIRYVQMPEDKAFHPLQSDSVNLHIEMSGWQLLIHSFRTERPQIQVNLASLRKRNWVSFSEQSDFIYSQFPVSQRIVSISPDTLYFDFSNQTERRVPVKPSYDLQFKKQYGIIDEIQSSPKYVTVSGPLEDVVQIENWTTDTIRATGVDRSLSAEVSLDNHQRANINVYPNTVQVNIPVGEMTEKIIEIPVKVENAKAFSSVKLLPSKVKLTVMVSLRDYAKVSANAFEAVVNLDHWTKEGIRNLPVLITKSPEYCKLIKIEPQNIDFFARK